MDKFLRKIPKRVLPQSPQEENDNSTKKQCADQVELNLEGLPSDPGLRKKLSVYSCNEHDKIRRYYLQKGPCQPQAHKFPQTSFGDVSRRFNPAWFKNHQNWLEYSISRHAAYCLCCYLFKPDFGKQSGGDAFVLEGFKSWNKATERLRDHVGRHDSVHNKALKQCEDLMNEHQSIQSTLQRQSDHDIVNAMKLVKVAKKRLQETRAKKWETLLAEVCSSCRTHDILVLNMGEMFVTPGRSSRKAKKITNYHHYKVEVFCSVLDRQLQELDNRFTEAGTKMLSYVACLSPENSFSAFNHENLINLA